MRHRGPPPVSRARREARLTTTRSLIVRLQGRLESLLAAGRVNPGEAEFAASELRDAIVRVREILGRRPPLWYKTIRRDLATGSQGSSLS